MEWVETTGKTVEEAVEAALDQLGVDMADAEYEVLEEPKTGLFGRLRTEARVRARVRPTTPRPKEERRGRGRKAASAAKAAAENGSTDSRSELPQREVGRAAKAPKSAKAGASRRAGSNQPTSRSAERETTVSHSEQITSIEDQGELAAEFVRGVLQRFGATTAAVSVHPIDDETVEVRVEGKDLGLLIGPTGAALQSLQELTRASVQRATGARSGRILVDISGYRQRRKESLERFARQIADDVLAGGVQIALNPMNPADRKVIHDTINEIEGVSTLSQGEEPQRRVVVTPS